ncbi:hypothetical protein [Azospirillum sp. TSO35-2]|uniref:hypothetical protein n=1 Tax=Azospirillum sp. TSO35-2 TaxID=716796 RepID=UPI000D62110B|nr:hypothetical protein [Azospirillum sp. TSO35-2]PWC39497.1 hypothetical protein TSO352_04950 [Azospirillum sp. TSO35-2]
MHCPHGSSTATTERSDWTAHGYRRFRCRECGRGFDERTGSVLNRLRLKLSLRDLPIGVGF